MDISLIIVNWNTKEHLRNCLGSVHRTVQGMTYEIIVVDNGSTDGSAAMVGQEFPSVKIIENGENRGFAAANNQALLLMRGRYALLLNTDTELTDGAVAGLYDFMETRPDAAMACGQLLHSDGRRQNAIASFPDLLTLTTNASLLEYLWPQRYPSKRYKVTEPVEIDSGVGACLLVRKKAIDVVGLLDERYFFFFEETDWAYRMKKGGWKIFHVPGAFIYHFQGQSIGRDARSRIEFYRARYQFFRKWRSPAYFVAVVVVIFIRLAVNWLFNACAVLATLGLIRSIRNRWIVYGKVLLWHLRGCPGRRLA